MRLKYVIPGSVISAIGFIGFSIYSILAYAPERMNPVFYLEFYIWIYIALAGIPIIVSGFVKKFHIVFAILSSFALVLIWFQTLRTF